MLGDVASGVAPETPGHQVPGAVLLADGAARVPGPVHRVFFPEVSGQEVDAGADRFGHLVREGPVGADLEFRAAGVDAVHVVPEVAAEEFPAVASEGAGVYPGIQASFLFEAGDGAGVVVGRGRPAFPVHPGAVQAVVEGELAQLGDQERIGVAAVGADRPFVRLAVGAFRRFIGMQGLVARVEDARIVGVQGYPFFAGDLPPDLEGVAGEAGHGVAHPAREGGPSGMPLAVHLEEVGTELPADSPDVFLLEGLADAAAPAAIRRSVEVKVQTEIAGGGYAGGAFAACRAVGPGVLRGPAAGRNQKEGDEETTGFHGYKDT